MTDVPDIAAGDTWQGTSARQWRNVMEAVQAFNSLTVGTGLTLQRSPNLVHIGMAPIPTIAGTSPVPVFSFQVVEVQRDSLLCHTWDGDTAGTEAVIVWRDPLLRRTPFDQKQRDGEWFDYSGNRVEPDFTIITDADGLAIEAYPEDHVTRTAFRFGEGRDKFGNQVIDSAIERILPTYFTGFVAGDPVGPTILTQDDHAGADIILAASIEEQTVEGVSAEWVEVSDRDWYVVSRVMHNASPEIL